MTAVDGTHQRCPLTLFAVHPRSREGHWPRPRRPGPAYIARSLARCTPPISTTCTCRVPLPGLAPPVVATFHSLAAAPAEVRAVNELHADVELRVDEPPFSSKQQVDVESACCKHMFQVF
jgi:hypothetical protein